MVLWPLLSTPARAVRVLVAKIVENYFCLGKGRKMYRKGIKGAQNQWVV